MAVKRGGLGRGLDSLIPNKKTSQKSETAANEKAAANEKTKKKDKGTKTKSSEKAAAKTAEKATAKTEEKAPVKTAEKTPAKTPVKTTEKAPAKTAEKTPAKTAEKTPAKTPAKTASKTDAMPVSQTPAKPAPKPAPKTAAKSADKPEEKPAVTAVTNEEPDLVSVSEQVTAAPKTDAEAVKPQGDADHSRDHVVMMKISQVEPNREQPRKDFDKDKLDELAESIRQFGVIQPLLVQKRDGYYEIIAGERRWRASQIAGLKEVPVIIRDYSEQEVVEISLIENIQREDLNPIEEANAYQRLIEEFHLTQESIAKRVSKSRAAVTNSIRLLRLPEEIREMLIFGDLSEGHARALLGLPDPEMQIKAARTVIKSGASVRDTEKLVKELLNPRTPKTRERDVQSDLVYQNLEEQMKQILGTKVAIRRKNKNAGRIEIEYYSSAELERLFDLLRSVTS